VIRAAPSLTHWEPHLQNVAVGAKIWGIVLEVTRQRLVISLPHGLRGFVDPVAAGDVMHSLLCDNPTQQQLAFRHLHGGPPPSLPDLFHPGQYVCGVITALDQTHTADDKARRSSVYLHLPLMKPSSSLSQRLDRCAVDFTAMQPVIVQAAAKCLRTFAGRPER
jgi:hypothetical protein